MKTTLLSSLLIIIPAIFFSQSTFNKRYVFDERVAVITNVETNDSCMYGMGVFAPFNSPVSGTFFAKFDFDGNIISLNKISDTVETFEVWKHTFIPFGNNFYSAGYSLTPDGMFQNLTKWKSTGDTLFSIKKRGEFFPNEQFTNPAAFVANDNGELIILDWAPNPNSGRIETIVTTLDSIGNEIWKKIIKHPSREIIPGSIISTENGPIVGAGRSNVGLTDINLSRQTYIAKFNTEGQLIWDFLSPEHRAEAKSMLLLDDKSLIIGTGYGEIEEARDDWHLMHFHLELMKIDSNQNLVWETKFRDTKPFDVNSLSKVLVAKDGSGFVFGGHHVQDRSRLVGVIGKVSNEGDSLWMRQYSFENDTTEIKKDQFVLDMECTEDGGYVLVGETNDYTPPSIQYGWMLKVDEYGCLIPNCHLSSTNDKDGESEIELSIYPNPTTDYLNFIINKLPYDNLSYRIINSEGKLMYQKEGINANVTYIVPLHSWAAGGYHLQIFSLNKLLGSKTFLKN